MSDEDRTATQEFAVQLILTGHCGEHLTADKIDQILGEITAEMRTGSTAWAFQPGSPQTAAKPRQAEVDPDGP
jgi:hypothetical protein